MLSTFKAIYDKLPKDKLKFLRYMPDQVLFGKSYKEYQSKISFDKNIVDQNLLNILEYARENTGFGHDNIPQDLSVENVKEVLESVPLVSSLDISTNLDYYKSKEYNHLNSYIANTGGTRSYGIPTKILLADDAYGIEWAHILYMWSYLDYSKSKDTKLTLRDKHLKDDRITEYNPIYNEVIIAPSKINESNAKRFIEEISKFDIKFIHGYPSFLKEFMVYFAEYNYRPKLKGIFLGSEGASIEDKHEFEKFFDTKVLHWYGLTEKVTLAADFDGNNIYKVFTSYGYPRIVNGELISTTFVNKALPLINFKTGDGAEIFEDKNSIYIKNLKGREGKDFVYVDEKKKIPIICIDLDLSIEEKTLLYQTVQNEIGKIVINLLPKPHARSSLERSIKDIGKNVTTLKDSGLDITYKIVNENEIMRSHRGKLIHLVQNLKE